MEREDEQKRPETETNQGTSINSAERPGAANYMTAASPPKLVSLEEIVQAENGIKNMALAHEIAVDQNFQLKKLEPSENSIQKNVKEIIHTAFWDLVAKQFAENPPNYAQGLVLLREIRNSLEELVLPRHTKIRDDLREILDIDLITQQAQKGVLDFKHYAHYVLSVMSKICAPVHDDRIRELAESTDVVQTLRGIMETIELMKLDLANFTITMIRPNIVASSIEYEKIKFAQFLEIQADGLRYTREWLLKHLDDEKYQAASVDDNGVKQVTHYLLTEAYLDLLNWDSQPQAETLMLDQGRLLELRDKVNRLTILGSILLLCNNTVGAPVQGVLKFKQRIKEHLDILFENVHSNKILEDVMPNIIIQVKQDVKTTLQEIGAPELPLTVENILEGQIMELVQEDHKIRSLVNLRIRQFLQKTILSQNTNSTQVPPGLSSLQEELTAIATRFFLLVAHNRSVFGDYYQDIVAKEVERRKSTLGILVNENNAMEV